MLFVLSCLLCASAALGMPESVRVQLADIENMSIALQAKMAATDEHMAVILRDGAHGLEWAAEFVECREQMLRRESYAAEESARRVQDLRREILAEFEAGIPTHSQLMCMPGCRPPAPPPQTDSRSMIHSLAHRSESGDSRPASYTPDHRIVDDLGSAAAAYQLQHTADTASHTTFPNTVPNDNTCADIPAFGWL